MIEFVSEELFEKATKSSLLTSQLLEQIKLNIELNQSNLESAIKIKEGVMDALSAEQALYKKNISLITDSQIFDLQQVIEDFGIAEKNFSGENVMLDMINAKKSQLELLENVAFEYQKVITYCKYIGNYMLATQESLLRGSRKIHKLVC